MFAELFINEAKSQILLSTVFIYILYKKKYFICTLFHFIL